MKDLKDFIRVMDSGDKWGNTMDWLLFLCDYCGMNDIDIPDALDYRPGLGFPSYDDYCLVDCRLDLLEAMEESEIQRAMLVLNRYADLLEANGHSY